jgi:hypothetical protein
MESFYHHENDGGPFLSDRAGGLSGLRRQHAYLRRAGFHIRRAPLTQLETAFSLNA